MRKSTRKSGRFDILYNSRFHKNGKQRMAGSEHKTNYITWTCAPLLDLRSLSLRGACFGFRILYSSVRAQILLKIIFKLLCVTQFGHLLRLAGHDWEALRNVRHEVFQLLCYEQRDLDAKPSDTIWESGSRFGPRVEQATRKAGPCIATRYAFTT